MSLILKSMSHDQDFVGTIYFVYTLHHFTVQKEACIYSRKTCYSSIEEDTINIYIPCGTSTNLLFMSRRMCPFDVMFLYIWENVEIFKDDSSKISYSHSKSGWI